MNQKECGVLIWTLSIPFAELEAFWESRQILQSFLLHVLSCGPLQTAYMLVLTKQHQKSGSWLHTNNNLFCLDVGTSPVKRGLQGWAEQSLPRVGHLFPRLLNTENSSNHKSEKIWSLKSRPTKVQVQGVIKNTWMCLKVFIFPRDSGFTWCLRFHDFQSTNSQQMKTPNSVTVGLYRHRNLLAQQEKELDILWEFETFKDIHHNSIYLHEDVCMRV